MKFCTVTRGATLQYTLPKGEIRSFKDQDGGRKVAVKNTIAVGLYLQPRIRRRNEILLSDACPATLTYTLYRV